MLLTSNIIQEPKSIYAVLRSGDTVSSCTLAEHAENIFLLLQLHMNAVLATEILYSPLLRLTKGKNWFKLQTFWKLNQIFICHFSMSPDYLNIVLVVLNDLLLLFPTSPLEVAASFRSTIPMVIAASVSPLSRKTADVWIPQKATKMHLRTKAFKFIKWQKVFIYKTAYHNLYCTNTLTSGKTVQ